MSSKLPCSSKISVFPYPPYGEKQNGAVPQADRGNRAIGQKFFFIIGVPSHAFLARMIKIKQATIEAVTAFSLNHLLYVLQCRCPGQCRFCVVRIGILKRGVAMPRHFPLGHNFSAIKFYAIMLPVNLFH